MLRHLITSGWLVVIAGTGVRRQIDLALAQSMDLQADEAARVRLVDQPERRPAVTAGRF